MTLDDFPFKEVDDNNIHIWSIPISKIPHEQQQEYYSLLSNDEKSKADKFRFPKDHNTYVIARGILRLLSGYYLNTNPKEIEFEYGKFGKPAFRKTSRLKFNVSHSENYILIGFVNDYAFGVDIECIKKSSDVLDLTRNYFSQLEIKSFESFAESDQYDAFFRCWVQKEAFIKAKGTGLSFPLDKFSVSLSEKGGLLETQWDLNEKDEWNLTLFSPEKNYIAALAVKHKSSEVKILDFVSFYF